MISLSTPPSKTCLVCAAAAAPYACPRCFAAYCSAACFARHGARCTEAFFRESARAELALRRAEDADADAGAGAGLGAGAGTSAGEARRSALAALARGGEAPHARIRVDADADAGCAGANADADACAGDEAEADADVDAAAAAVERLEFLRDAHERDAASAVAALTPDERVRLARAAARGDLSDAALREWQPWWTRPLVHHRLAVAAALAEAGAAAPAAADADAVEAPPPCLLLSVRAALPPLSALLGERRAASPLLRFSVVDVLLAYAHTQRLFGGVSAVSCSSSGGEGAGADANEAAAVLLAVSRVLSEDARHVSVAAACASAAEASLAAPVRRTAAADARTALLLLQDGADLLREPHFVVDALADARDLVAAAAAGAAADARARGARRAGAAALDAAARKLHFLASWARETLVASDEGSSFDRVAAGVESGAAVCASLRRAVCDVLAEHLEFARASEAVVRAVRE
jgi:hypothetical protein